MNKFFKMIVKVTALFIIFETLVSPSISTMEFTLYPKTMTANIKYCFIPRSPIRILYKRKNEIMASPYSNFKSPSTYFNSKFDYTKNTQNYNTPYSFISNSKTKSTSCDFKDMDNNLCLGWCQCNNNNNPSLNYMDLQNQC